MKLLARLFIVLALCLTTISLLAAPAQGNGAGASITLSPSQGIPGTAVNVYGYNFTADSWVGIYYYVIDTEQTWEAEVKADGNGDFRVTFTIPESYKGHHTVYAEDQVGKSASRLFEVKPALTASPEEGPVGTTVTVQGRGFAKDESNIELRYFLDSSTSQVVVANIKADGNGSWEKSFQIPPSSKGSHRIDAKGDASSFTAVKDAFFAVTPGISLDKSSGSVGESITMTGSGFYAGDRYIEILFAGQAVVTEIRADATGYWQESFQVPEKPKGTYSVTAEGESTPKEDISALSFEIKPGLLLSPEGGHVGMNVTVAGGGFPINEDVVIKYEGNEKATAATDNKGSFEVSFVVPKSQHGGHQVTAEDTAGNNATATFIMESDRPGTPELISPPEGDRVGFVGKIRPTFEWTELFDESGVYYRLQIATSANVTATGLASPRVTVPDIVGTNYTLEKKDALPYGTYYWRVQAVDGAGNAGNWTTVYSFRAGVLPLWAFILIIVAVVAAIGAAVYFFIIRKRIYYY